MKINRTSDELIKINKLKNIKSITFKDLYETRAKEKNLIIPGFIVLSDQGFMYLTSSDEYFEDFVRRIREIYNEEKDETYEDGILGEKKLEVDPLTKSILENGHVSNTSNLYSFYKDKASYQESLLFESDKLKSFGGIIFHHIKETMKLLNKTITDVRLSNGMNGIYYLSCRINNQPQILPMTYQQIEDDSYHVVIGNLFDKAIPLNMEIMFTKNGISVNNCILEYNLTDYTKYEFNQKGTMERKVHLDKELKHYEKKDLPTAANVPENLAKLDNGESVSIWYQLPWNTYEGISITDKGIEEDGSLSDGNSQDRLITERLVYLSIENNDFFIKDTLTKRYRKKSSKREERQEVIFDSLDKEIIGLQQRQGYIIETSFLGTAITGFYKTNLLGNKFYHISHELDQTKLTKKNIKTLGREDGLEEKVDLLDIKKYIK